MGVKIPGLGEVKPVYLYAGGGALVLSLGYAYYKSRKSDAANAANAAAAAQATAATQNQGDGSIDPVTGIPYADEGSEYDYGGIDPATGIPYEYENTALDSDLEYGTQSNYSTNEEWAEAAIADAQSDLNATQALAQQAVGDYLAQNPQGLPANEYTLMSELLALVGNPPVGSFTLHEQSGSASPGGPSSGTPIAPGTVIQVPVALTPQKTVQYYANEFGESVEHLISANPGLTLTKTSGTINIPYQVKPNDTLEQIAADFKISEAHLEQDLQAEGLY